MINLKNFDRKKLFKSKAKIGVLLLVAVLVLFAVVYKAIIKSQEQKEEVKKAESTKDIKVKTTDKVMPTDELWRNTFEEKMQEQADSHSVQTGKQIDEIKKIIEQNESEKGDNKHIEAKISNLTREVQDIKAGSNIKINETPIAKSNEISQYNLDLENAQDSDKYKTLKTADNYIPAGSFAKAVLLSGVDAETGLNSSSEPDPILIRIIDHGTLPRKFKSDLKDCHLIGAAYGNLSSERAKIRLEKLSCTEIATAEIVETEVAGYVTGEDGRAGIRGEVVSTEGKLLTNSFAAGLLSGFSDTINPRTSSSPGTVIQEIKDGKMPKQGTNEKLKVGFASGASSSMDRLSKYYIDRAESLQPIVQIGAGRKVDVIFTEGVFFGSSELKKAIAKKRDEAIKNKSGNADASLIRQLD